MMMNGPSPLIFREKLKENGIKKCCSANEGQITSLSNQRQWRREKVSLDFKR